MFGDLLRTLTDDATAVEALLNEGDLTLLATVRKQAAGNGMDVGAYVVQAVQRYSATASDEEWMTLAGMLNRSANPGMTYIRRALEYASLA